MTWVIGASSIFGYGVMLSDVRVTFPGGRQADLVQKAFGIGPFMVAGFAGSIKIGFQMLESLERLLVVPSDAPQPGAWEPEKVAERWKPIAANIFATADPIERAARSEILLVGISQTLRPEVESNPRALKLPRVCIIRFASPHFDPVVRDRPL